MKTTCQLTAVIEREDDIYVALCPELDIASQGDTVESAKKNLVERPSSIIRQSGLSRILFES